MADHAYFNPNPIQLRFFGRVLGSTVGSVSELRLPTILVHLKKMPYIGVAFQKKNVRDGSNINHNSGLYNQDFRGGGQLKDTTEYSLLNPLGYSDQASTYVKSP